MLLVRNNPLTNADALPPTSPGGRVMKSRSHLLTLVGTALLGAVAGVFAWAAPAHAATINYVALGDSYSSGVGAGGYDPASGICERNPPSYTALWAACHPGTAVHSVAFGDAPAAHVVNHDGN